MNLFSPGDLNRRGFMSSVVKAAATGALLSTPGIDGAKSIQNVSWTVGQIMDLFIKEVPGAPFSQTVDTLKSGNREIKVTGIATTMFATIDVIRKSVDAGANFIIAHEPTFYNHLDDTNWLSNDPVYQYKMDLLRKHNIAVWRNHDYIHRLVSDGVMAGVVKQLGWEKFASDDRGVFEIQPTNVRALISDVKSKFGIPTVRYIGGLSESCKKVLLMPGASGGRNQIASIARVKPDVVLCGEISEWETAEYVRDARSKGDRISLVVLGHVASEEPGSKFLADWLKQKVSSVPVHHIPAENSLMFV